MNLNLFYVSLSVEIAYKKRSHKKKKKKTRLIRPKYSKASPALFHSMD